MIRDALQLLQTAFNALTDSDPAGPEWVWSPTESLSAIGLNSELKADNVAYDGQPVGYIKLDF